jgi:asparagine synthetase B (glutamine-hydrolysing)
MRKILSRRDINEAHLLHYIRDGWLPIPHTIIPPNREYFLWNHLETQPYAAHSDYRGQLLDRLKTAVSETLAEWKPLRSMDRVGVWLSGGVDSSTLLHLTTEILGPERVRAYSIDFGDRQEVQRAQLIADHCHVKLILKNMTGEDSIHLTKESILLQRSPVDITHVLFAAKLCTHDGTQYVLSALGLDELQGGYPEHVNASNHTFSSVETQLLWKCQSSYAWFQKVQSEQYVSVKFPFLQPMLIAWCCGLPRHQKCKGSETKVRLRKELHDAAWIPRENIEAGRQVGTKGGFCSNLESWFNDGFAKWAQDNLPPHGLSPLTTRKICNLLKDYLWRTWRAATINTFIHLLDNEQFTIR